MDQESECPLLGIVDDDEGIRLALDSLMRSVGYRRAPEVCTFSGPWPA